MPAESPLALSAEFRSTNFGQKADLYLEELLEHQDCFPLSIGRTGAILGFVSEAVGDKTLREWQQGGILLNPSERGMLLPTVMVAKLAVMRIFYASQQGQKPTYREIYYQLQKEDLRESQLQDSLGNLNDEFGDKKAVVRLEKGILFDEKDRWWLDTSILRPARRVFIVS